MASLLVALIMVATAAGAWIGAAWFVFTIPPTRPLAETGLYVFLFTAISTTAALGAWIASRPRDPGGALRSPATFIGHSMLLAAIVLFGFWLQSLRMLTPVVALLLAGLYALLELALLFGTRGAVDVEVTSNRFGAAEL